MELFTKENNDITKFQPLAARIIPKELNEFFGQEHILGKGKLLRRIIESDRIGSMIFYGPPGCGKSALAKIVANKTKSEFIETNAVTIGVADIRNIINSAYKRLKIYNKKTILLLDEIHHFNRSQQDALLPDVEKGIINLIGITTENPYFYVNFALLSRSSVFEFKRLSDDDIRKIINRALTDVNYGLGRYKIKIDEEAINHIVRYSEGDARRALNAVELSVIATEPEPDGVIHVNIRIAEESMQKKFILYDKKSDQHYDHISAFIKSLRGSDPDAAVYWLVKMLDAGEDPRFIARRIIIAASEDVGNADPNALIVATSALTALEFVGMPEGKIPLVQSAIYVACAPKSNATYNALSLAENEVQKGITREVPIHLKDPNVDGENRGHGKGYLYPHNFKDHFVVQEYLPNPKIFYTPSEQGYELEIKKRLDQWRKKKNV